MLNKISQWLKGLFSNQRYFTGVLPDNRALWEKDEDYLHEERVPAGTTVDPFSNPQITQSPYPYENQNGTSSCVPHGVGLALAIERKADANLYQRLAWIFAYRQRSNYPTEGSVFQNIFQLYRENGAPLYTTLPTPMTEVEANNITLNSQEFNEAAIYEGLTYFTVTNFNDITTLATIAAQGHAVAILLYASFNDYAKQYPTMNDNVTEATAEVVHCVCILPNSGFTENGVKYVAIQDSAWFGGFQLRYLSEAFIKARVYAAGYWTNVSVMGGGPLPQHHFSETLSVGDTGDEVKALQQLLIAENFLPADCATGLFGGMTLAGVKSFQMKYAGTILMPNGLSAPTGYWGVSSIAQANTLCTAPPAAQN